VRVAGDDRSGLLVLTAVESVLGASGNEPISSDQWVAGEIQGFALKSTTSDACSVERRREPSMRCPNRSAIGRPFAE
jgi:hypothetical protein